MKDSTRRRAGDNDVTAGFLLAQQALVNLDESGFVESGGAVTEMQNSGTGGSAYDLDVVVGTGANLRKSISDACLMYGASGDYVSTPDSAAASITGDIDIRVKAALDDWTPAADNTLAAKWTASGNQRSYRFSVTTAGLLELQISADGIINPSAIYTSSLAPSVSNGNALHVRFTLDVDNGSSDSDCTFYTSADGISWTQLGTVRNSGSVESIFDGTAAVQIGALNAGTANNIDGSIYQAQIYNGIEENGGTLAVDFNAADYVNKASDTTFNSNLMAANLPGASGDYVSTPDSAAASITGDIEGRFKLAMDDWTPAAAQVIASKFGASGNRSWSFSVTTGGLLSLAISAGGTTFVTTTSSIAPTVSDGSVLWVRFAWDDSADTVNFYTSSDGETWAQLGTADLALVAAGIFDSTAPVEIGSNAGGTNPLTGSIYQAQIYNGIDGTLAVSFDAQDFVTGSTLTSSDTGEVWTANGNAAFTGQWTLNGNTFIQNTGNSVVHSIGSAGLESTAGQTIASPGTVFAVARFSGTPAANSYIFDSRTNISTDRWSFLSLDGLSDRFTIYQGSSTVSLSEAFDNSPHVWTGQFNGGATTKLTVSSVGSVTGNAGAGSFDYGSLFIKASGVDSLSGYIGQLIVFDRALSESEVQTVLSYLTSKFAL